MQKRSVEFVTFLLCSFLMIGPATLACAAEYNGHDLDGEEYDGTAYSSGTGHSHSVQVEFEGDDAIVTFSNHGTRTIALDNEEIDDPHTISGTDSDGVSWELDVDGLD